MIAGLRPLVSSSLLLLGALSPFAVAQQASPNPTAPLSAPSGIGNSTVTPSAAPASSVPSDPAGEQLKGAYEMVGKKNFDGALTVVDQALKTNPRSFAALTLRGMIYSQKKQWAPAQADFAAALALEPNNVVLKLNVAELTFTQKKYDEARPEFQAFTSDKVIGDFAAYKVYMCDLVGGHQDLAAKELAVFNQAAENPSYYFANAAWDFTHNNVDGAKDWLVRASHIYYPKKNQFYSDSLRQLGYLPLPTPGGTPTAAK